MRIVFVALLAVTAVFLVFGCGGDTEDRVANVRILEDQFEPKVATVLVGDTVSWINSTGTTHKIVSGTLSQVPNPEVLTPIAIRANEFEPEVVNAGFGDTVRWRNDTVRIFVLDIVNEEGDLIASFLMEPGDIVEFSGFPTAGRYMFQERGNPLFDGTLTLFGIPNPDGIFESPILNTGETFSRPFNTPGTFPYFDLNVDDPSLSFRTGRVVVQ